MKFSALCMATTFLMFAGLSVAEPPQPTGRSIRAIVADKYPEGTVFIGATAHGVAFKKAPDLIAILDREFSYVTPSNDFKQTAIHPEPGKWNWTLAKTWLEHAQLHGQTLRIHGPISPQASKWAMEDQRTAAELRQNLQEYMTGQCRLYANLETIRWLDVVNETIDEDGSWFGPKPGTDHWENPWPIMGLDTDADRTPLYIAEAFTIANREAPRLKQIINQHALTEASVARMKTLVMYLRGKGLRVDGVGWQAHIESGWELEPGNQALLNQFIAWAHANQLEFHITEFQARIRTKKERQTKWNAKPVHVSEKELEKRFPAQAATFAAVLATLLKHRGTGVVTMNYWHLTDSQSQDKDGNMFNDDGSPRPAYYAIQQTLENPPAAVLK